MSDVLDTTGQSSGYWRETRQPIYSAALVLPFLLVYELGLLFLRSDVINGGDAILLNLGGPIMRQLGLQGSFASVVVLALLFIAMQIRRKGSWSVRSPLLVAAFLESVLYAALLFVILGYFVQYLPGGKNADRTPRGPSQRPSAVARACTPVECPEMAPQQRLRPASPAAMAGVAAPEPRSRASGRPGLRDFILFCGAGVYEELVFRVILLSLLVLVFTKLFHMEHAYAAVWAVLLGAVIFSAFHHIGGQAFALGVFLQRVFAGLYFAAIYFNRSFGVAAASHSMYDMLVGLNQYA